MNRWTNYKVGQNLESSTCGSIPRATAILPRSYRSVPRTSFKVADIAALHLRRRRWLALGHALQLALVPGTDAEKPNHIHPPPWTGVSMPMKPNQLTPLSVMRRYDGAQMLFQLSSTSPHSHAKLSRSFIPTFSDVFS